MKFVKLRSRSLSTLADLGIGVFYLILGILAFSQYSRGPIFVPAGMVLIVVGMYFFWHGLDTK